MALLEIDGVSKAFGATVAVDDVSLTVDPGEFFALLGPSGCGKTTLLRLIAGFETADSGHIRIDGTEMTALPPYARPVNLMFQSYALFPHLDVAANIEFGLRTLRMERRRRAERVAEMLALVQMNGLERRRPHELSGGQKQRVALARALARMPKLLLLDEPLAALDRKLRETTRLELTGIQQRIGTSFVVVTHDQEEALGLASRIAVMKDGRLIQTGTPADIYERPNSRFVAGFVGTVNLLPPRAGTGQGGTLAVRPEKLRLSREQPAGFAIAATITSIGYQGGISTVHLTPFDGPSLVAALPSDAARRLERGASVWVSWAPEDAIALPD